MSEDDWGDVEIDDDGDGDSGQGADTLYVGERLQKVLARSGVGSRRVCEDLIVDGRVTVNGDVPVLGRRVDTEVDVIELDGAHPPRPRPLPGQQAPGRRLDGRRHP